MKKLLFTVIAALLLVLTSCSENTTASTENEASSRDLFAMDTFMTMKAWGTDRESALSEAALKITELEAMLSVTDENSEIYRAGHSEGKKTEISPETAGIISFALDISEKTSGALNPMIYPVLREWGFTTGEYRIPDSKTIETLLKNTDYRKVRLSGNSIQIPDGMLIDLGAAAKGYTSDAVSEIMRKHGIESAVISLGGNVQTVGSKPDGSDWKVSVRDPFDESSQMCIISVSDKAVVTSGNYERFFTGEDGRRYCHIINPADGYPADNGLASVTIVSESGILCDCISTAMFVKGKKGASEYWQQNEGFEMIMADSRGEITITEGLENCTEVINGMKTNILKKVQTES